MDAMEVAKHHLDFEKILRNISISNQERDALMHIVNHNKNERWMIAITAYALGKFTDM